VKGDNIALFKTSSGPVPAKQWLDSRKKEVQMAHKTTSAHQVVSTAVSQIFDLSWYK
jgi:hypothetical protein